LSAQFVYVLCCAARDSHNKYQLVTQTALTGWALVIRKDHVVCWEYNERLHVLQVNVVFKSVNIIRRSLRSSGRDS
jgi:hypothetical protein